MNFQPRKPRVMQGLKLGFDGFHFEPLEPENDEIQHTRVNILTLEMDAYIHCAGMTTASTIS